MLTHSNLYTCRGSKAELGHFFSAMYEMVLPVLERKRDEAKHKHVNYTDVK